jgi:2,4-dienoyl-CoA reductase-like NADH-dependent reductase (Old Yellow Enzyme family)
MRVGVDSDDAIFSDDELDELAEDFILAATRAAQAGFRFVDVKHCHGYLGHELLSAVDRPGRYGGDLSNRMNFLRTVVSGIRNKAPELAIGVRLSIFDFLPFKPGSDGVGIPEASPADAQGFGGDASGLGVDLSETHDFLDAIEAMEIELVCTTAGSPYYNPHIQRPAFFAPSDGYKPPEDPLVGVSRQIQATAQLRARHPKLVFVGSGYSYLQEWLPNVAQYVVREGLCDVVGIGRMALSYPTMPADVIAGRPLERRAICRTFSDCTTAPRNHLVSGCYPIDAFYKERPEAAQLAAIKKVNSG